MRVLGFVFSIFICLQLQSQETFTDVTAGAGIDFRYTFGDRSYVNILESSGSGVTVFDYNGDGLMDMYMMNGTYIPGVSDAGGKMYSNTPDKLYKNNGNGTFTEVAEKAGLADKNWSMAAGAVDYDNDGDQDLYLLNYGPNVFFRNNGDGTFTDVTARLGLQGPAKLNGFTKWSIGVSFWDYNHDGRLDAMVGNFLAFDPAYVSPSAPGMMPSPSEYKGQASMLYEQQSDGTFKDVTRNNHLFYPDSKCMGLTVYDYDDDGDLDIFQANDHQLNYLFKNNQGQYKEVAVAAGVAANSEGEGTGSMHATIGDVDGDGLVDILVTDLSYGALYKNMGNGVFKDITASSGLQHLLSGKGSWGAALCDFDNDGDLDLFAANGTAEELILQLPLYLVNDGKGHFSNAGSAACPYFNEKRSGRGLAVLDYNNDGQMDIIVSHVDLKATAALLKNNGNNNHWLGITLEGKNGPADAIAAKVTIWSGSLKQVVLNQWTTGYLSNSDPRMHIGLGKNAMADRIEVTWNDGTRETYTNVVCDRYITIRQGKGIISKWNINLKK